MPVSAKDLFLWHHQPMMLERLIFPSHRVDIISKEGIALGKKLELKLHFGPISCKWVAEYVDYIANDSFSDIQIKGPFSYWKHTHECIDLNGDSLLKDHVEYRIPLGKLGQRIIGNRVHEELHRLFSYRHRVTAADLAVLKRYRRRPKQRILITNNTCTIGRGLEAFLSNAGHEVVCLVRDKDLVDPNHVYWNPDTGEIIMALLEKCDAVVHLNVAPLFHRLWSSKQRQFIRHNHVEATAFLTETLRRLKHPPHSFLCASSWAYYGTDNEAYATEKSRQGEGFIEKVCGDKEAIALAYSGEITTRRTVLMRFGTLISAAEEPLKSHFKYLVGLGTVFGTGEQEQSWITVDDAIYAIYHLLMDPHISGPVNMCTPIPTRQSAMAKTIASVLNRKARWRIPAWLARAIYGAPARYGELANCPMKPRVLERTDFDWCYLNLEEAIRHQLCRWPLI